MYDPGVVKVLETLHDLEDVSGGQGLVHLMMHREIVVEALTLTTEEKQNMKMSVITDITYIPVSYMHKNYLSGKVQTG